MGDWVKKQVEGVPLSVELDILLDLNEIIKKQDLTIVGLFEDENTPLYQEYMKAGNFISHLTQKTNFLCVLTTYGENRVFPKLCNLI